MERIVSDSIIYPPSIPSSFATILQTALNVDVEQRYQTMEQMSSSVYSNSFATDTLSNSYVQNTNTSLSAEEELALYKQKVEERKRQEKERILKEKELARRKHEEEQEAKRVMREMALMPEYEKAMEYFAEGKFQDAKDIFKKLGDLKNSKAFLEKAKAEIKRIEKEIEENRKSKQYQDALAFMKKENYEQAERIFEELGDYRDSKEQLKIIEIIGLELVYISAVSCFENEHYVNARDIFSQLKDFKDSKERYALADKKVKEIEKDGKESNYNIALKYIQEKEYEMAKKLFKYLNDYKDSKHQLENVYKLITEDKYSKAVQLYNEKKYSEAFDVFDEIINYKDSRTYFDKINRRRKNITTIIFASLGFIITILFILETIII